MATSCKYPDRRLDEMASNSSIFSEQLASFDLSYHYTVMIEEEVNLFFASVFNLKPSSNSYGEILSKGKAVQYDDAVIYCWNDIPMLSFKVYTNPETYGFEIECHRLYRTDDSRCY
jgi:hypothetical protein